MQIIIQPKKELAEILEDETVNWFPAIKAAALEVQQLNAAFGENPIYCNPDAERVEDIFRSTYPTEEFGLIKIDIPNYDSLWQSQFPAMPQTFWFIWGNPQDCGKYL
jgi:hypothetical protein